MHLWGHIWSNGSSFGTPLQERYCEPQERLAEDAWSTKHTLWLREMGWSGLIFRRLMGISLQSSAAKWGLFRRWNHTALRVVCLKDKRQQSQLAAKEILTGCRGKNLFTVGVIKHLCRCPKKICNVYPLNITWRLHVLGQTLSNLIQPEASSALGKRLDRMTSRDNWSGSNWVKSECEQDEETDKSKNSWWKFPKHCSLSKGFVFSKSFSGIY